VYAERALAINRETGNPRSECLALCQLARAAAAEASPAGAREYFRQALAVSRRAADQHAEAWTLTYIGAESASQGAENEAVRAWEEAIRLFDALDDPQAGHLRGRLVSILTAKG
jgi:tetratricopeptide (TPR) repeat protein